MACCLSICLQNCLHVCDVKFVLASEIIFLMSLNSVNTFLAALAKSLVVTLSSFL